MGYLDEAICYDGLENFAGTQYDPNYINQAVGDKSLFIYDFNFAPLNRKGRMSDRQKVKNKELEVREGAYPRNAIQKASTVLFKRLLKKVRPGKSLEILSDQHFAYRRAIECDLKGFPIEHGTISSKAYRDFKNILFPVNHADLLIRHQSAAFKRETIAFSKTHARMCQKFLLFMIDKNYMRPQFTKKHVRRPRVHRESPAQYLKLTTKILEFSDFFDELRTQKQVPLPEEWALIIQGSVPYPRQLHSRKDLH